ncbi:MAG: hypothetical protein AAGJ08_01070 [Cyanobacteria bacterium P01_H01_bin.35]
MVTLDKNLLSSDVSENKKRQRIRKYFFGKLKWKYPIALLVIALLILFFSSEFEYGLLFLIAGGCWLFFEVKSIRSSPGDKGIDAWLIEDINYLKERSLQRLNIDQQELIRESIVIRSPVLWDTRGVPTKEIAWKKGKDKVTRFSINAITIIHLTEHKLSSYQCVHNFIKGVPLNEKDDEFHYRDVVAVSTRDISTNYSLPDRALMKHGQLFKLSVSSGDSVEAIVSSDDLVKFTGGTLPDTGVDGAVKALRKVLSEKKI